MATRALISFVGTTVALLTSRHDQQVAMTVTIGLHPCTLAKSSDILLYNYADTHLYAHTTIMVTTVIMQKHNYNYAYIQL
jgi:hypothetical protein